MPTKIIPTLSRAGFRRGFTLIEILVVVALLSVIIIGLTAMFNQTQRALLGSNAQTDVLASGRAVSALLAGDLEQMTPSKATNTQNFHLEMETGSLNPSATPLYLVLKLANPSDSQVTVMDRAFFVTCSNQQWTAIGYAINTPPVGLGTLYRFSYPNAPITQLSNLLSAPLSAAAPNSPGFESLVNNGVWTNFNGWGVSRIADGVMNFRLRAYDTNGSPVTNIFHFNPTLGIIATNIAATPIVVLPPPPAITNDFSYAFYSNAVPVSLELELGVLEPATLQHFYGLTNNYTASTNYLVNHAGQVHLFRQRVSIRSVEPLAYQ